MNVEPPDRVIERLKARQDGRAAELSQATPPLRLLAHRCFELAPGLLQGQDRGSSGLGSQHGGKRIGQDMGFVSYQRTPPHAVVALPRMLRQGAQAMVIGHHHLALAGQFEHVLVDARPGSIGESVTSVGTTRNAIRAQMPGGPFTIGPGQVQSLLCGHQFNGAAGRLDLLQQPFGQLLLLVIASLSHIESAHIRAQVVLASLQEHHRHLATHCSAHLTAHRIGDLILQQFGAGRHQYRHTLLT